MAENLLDINTKEKRPTIRIDGNAYELKHPNEFSLADFHALSAKGKELIDVSKQYQDEPNAGFELLSACMSEALDMVMPDLPREIGSKLNPFHINQIILAFMRLTRADGLSPEVHSMEPQS